MSYGRQGEAFNGQATLSKFHRATRPRPANRLGVFSTTPSSYVHGAIVRLIGLD